MIRVSSHRTRRTRVITKLVTSSMNGFVIARIIRDCLIAERQHQLLPRRQHRHLPRLQSLLRRHASLSGESCANGGTCCDGGCHPKGYCEPYHSDCPTSCWDYRECMEWCDEGHVWDCYQNL